MKKKLTKKQRDDFATIGRLGGKASFKKRGKKGMSEMGKKGMASRWAKKRKETVDNLLAK